MNGMDLRIKHCDGEIKHLAILNGRVDGMQQELTQRMSAETRVRNESLTKLTELISNIQSEVKEDSKSIKTDIQRMQYGQTNLNKTLDHAFVKIDSKDKDLDIKLSKFRPEKYGLASKEMVNDNLMTTRKTMHDKVREME